MWEWWSGKPSAKKADESNRDDRHAHQHKHINESAQTAVAAKAQPNAGAAVASSSSSQALVVSAPSSGSPSASAPSAAAAGGSAEFWGFTSEEGFRADDDPALDDMLQFYGFSHQRQSEYAGAVCFKLTYPDGAVSIKTVQVLPRGESQQLQEAQRRVVEEKAASDASQAMVVAAAQARPHARMRTYPPRLTAGAADSDSDSASTALVPFSHNLVSAWLPAPCVSLTIRTRAPPMQTSDALVPSSAASSALAVAAAVADPPLSLPCSPRVRVYSGPVPKHVKLSATLSCPRDVFFDVYMGRLDPMTAVLTGKAHCAGYRYMALLHFGQAFQLETTKWQEFYAAQEEVQKDQRRRAAAGGLLLGPGSSGGGSAGGVSGGNSTLRLTSGSGDANSGFALPTGSGSGALAFAPAFVPALGVSTALGLVDWARARAAAAASRIAVTMRATTVDSSSVAALAAPPRSRCSHWRISAHAPVPPPFVALRRSPSAAAAAGSLAPASVTSQLRSFYRFAAHLNAHTNVTFACDEYA